MYVCMYVSMYVCMYLSIFKCIYIHPYFQHIIILAFEKGEVKWCMGKIHKSQKERDTFNRGKQIHFPCLFSPFLYYFFISLVIVLLLTSEIDALQPKSNAPGYEKSEDSKLKRLEINILEESNSNHPNYCYNLPNMNLQQQRSMLSLSKHMENYCLSTISRPKKNRFSCSLTSFITRNRTPKESYAKKNEVKQSNFLYINEYCSVENSPTINICSLKKKYRDGCISTIGNIRKVSTNSYTKIQAGKNLEEGGKNAVISPQYVYQDTKLDKDTVYGNSKYSSLFDGVFHHQPAKSGNNTSTIPAIPTDYTLRKLIIIHRHGDRTPITKTIGNVLSDHNRDEFINQWAEKLPKPEEIQRWNNQFPITPSNLKPLDYQEEPYAQLTKRGARQLYNIGRAIRQHYFSNPVDEFSSGWSMENNMKRSFLDDTNLELGDLIFARATNIRRTQQSLQNLLRGILVMDDDDNEKKSLNTSIPIHIVPTEEEYLYPNSAGQCPRQTQIVTDTRSRNYDIRNDEKDESSSEDDLQSRKDIACKASSLEKSPNLIHDFSTKLQSFEQLRDYCYETFCYDKEKYQYIPFTHVKEVMLCHLVHDVKLPKGMEGFSAEWLKKIMNFTVFMWGKWFYNQELLRLGIGPFLQEIIDVITTTSNKNIPNIKLQNGKIFVYSGHDSTIVPLLCTLRNFNTEKHTAVWPPYASTIIMEVCEKNNMRDESNDSKTMIRFLYNDQELEIPIGDTSSKGEQKEELKTWLSLEELMKLWSPLIPQDFTKECQLK